MRSSLRTLRTMIKPLRIRERAYSQSTADKTIRSNQATIETLHSHEGKRVRLFTLPIDPLLINHDGLEGIAQSLNSALLVFCLDPLKALKHQRSIYNSRYEQVYKTKAAGVPDSNIITLTSPFEAVFEFSFFKALIAKEVKEDIDLNNAWRVFSDLFLCKWDLYFCNANIKLLLMYMTLVAKTTSRISFGSYPEPLFRAKLSDLISKNDFLNSYLNLLKEFAHSTGSKKDLHFASGIYDPNDLAQMRFSVNTQMIKSKYFWEYSKVLVQSSKDDVILVADPLLRKQIKTLKFIDDEKSQMAINSSTSSNVINFIEHQFENHLKDLFGETELEQLEREERKFDSEFRPANLANFASIRHPNDFSFLQFSFKETTKIQSFEIPDSEEAQDKVFIMALLDVLHKTTLCESEFVDNKFFYINPEKKRFSEAQIQDLEKRFYVNYRGIQKIREAIMENIQVTSNAEKLSSESDLSIDEAIEFGGLVDLDE